MNECVNDYNRAKYKWRCVRTSSFRSADWPDSGLLRCNEQSTKRTQHRPTVYSHKNLQNPDYLLQFVSIQFSLNTKCRLQFTTVYIWSVARHSGRTSVFGRRTLSVLRSTCIRRVTIYHRFHHHMVFLKWPKQQRHHEDHYSQSSKQSQSVL